MPGQAGAVAAGAFDPGQAHGPEPAQPAQQAAVAGRGGRELPGPSSPPIGSSAAATCTSAWVTRSASDCACLYDGQGLSEVEGWHAPAGRRICETRPLAQAGQIRPAPLAAARNNPGPRPADRFAGQPGRASADSQARPGPRLPTLCPCSVKIGEAGPEALPTLSLPTLGASKTGRFARDSAQNIHSGYAERQGFFVLGRPRA